MPVTHRLAPAGIYFTTEYMSVRSSNGITGIPPGTRIEVLKDMGDAVRVTTGQLQFDAKKYQLTNDLDTAAKVSSQDAAQQAQIAVGSSRASTAINVMRATYGYGDKLVDVINEIRGRVQTGQMSIRAGNDLGGDPAPGKVKSLTIQYAIGGGTPLVVTAREGESISLGQPSQHHETARQKQEVSKRPIPTAAPTWKNPLDSWPAGGNPLETGPAGSNPLERGPHGGSWSSRDTKNWQGNPLEGGAYDRTQDKKYTDGSGRTYWIDIRGQRHYDHN
jgi:hypothetical protein